MACAAPAVSIIATPAKLPISAPWAIILFMERSSSILDGFTNFAAWPGGGIGKHFDCSPRPVSIPHRLADIYCGFESRPCAVVASHRRNIARLYGIYDTAVMRYGTWMHFAINIVAPHTDYVHRNNSASESVAGYSLLMVRSGAHL
jgi:hypothetical protein